MFSRIASVPLHVVNGVSLRRGGRIAPKVEQGPFNGLSIAPAASSLWSDSGSAAVDPFLWTPSPRRDFKDLTGLDFGYRPSPSDEVPWYEKLMDLSGLEFDERCPASGESPSYDQSNMDWFMHEDSKPFNEVSDFSECVTFEKLDSIDFDGLFEDFENNPYADVKFEYENVIFDWNGTVVQKVPEECVDGDVKTKICDDSTVAVPNRRVRTNLPLTGFPVNKKVCRSPSKLEIASSSDGSLKAVNYRKPLPSASGRPQRSCRRRSCLELVIHSINLSDELVSDKGSLLQSKDRRSRPRGVTRKPYVDPKMAVRRARNCVSARKYRDKKRLEKVSIKRERELLEVRHADLRMQVQLLLRNIEDMKKLINI